MAVAERRLKHWGWGHEDQQLDRAALEATGKAIHERLGFEVDEIEEPVPFDEIEVPKPRLKARRAGSGTCSRTTRTPGSRTPSARPTATSSAASAASSSTSPT